MIIHENQLKIKENQRTEWIPCKIRRKINGKNPQCANKGTNKSVKPSIRVLVPMRIFRSNFSERYPAGI